MRKPVWIVTLSLLLLSRAAFGQISTTSLYAGIHNFADVESDIINGGMGPGLRWVKSPKGSGFYFGGDIYIGIPIVPASSVTGEIWPMYLSVKVPLGRRWPGEGRTMGFYIGAGPEFQLVTDFMMFTEWYVSLFLDLGWQTNRTEGVGFHFGFQLSICPYKWIPYNPYFWLPIPTFATMFQVGVSWRRPVRN